MLSFFCLCLSQETNTRFSIYCLQNIRDTCTLMKEIRSHYLSDPLRGYIDKVQSSKFNFLFQRSIRIDVLIVAIIKPHVKFHLDRKYSLNKKNVSFCTFVNGRCRIPNYIQMNEKIFQKIKCLINQILLYILSAFLVLYVNVRLVLIM